MKILFIDNFSFNFGVASISAVLKQQGHNVELLYYPFSKLRGIDIYRDPGKYFSFEKISNEVIAKRPDIIGFSVFSANYMFYKNVASAIRNKKEIPILVGGVFPTMSPEFFINNSCCDVVFRGEAELVIEELIEKMATKTYHDVPNIVYRNNDGSPAFNKMESFVVDLDSLPFHDKEICPSSTIALNMITSRGCVFSCAYCSSGKYTKITDSWGVGKVRKRSVDSVIEEIKQALSKQPYKSISFWDDFFITTPQWLSDFTVKYTKEINLPYSCIAFPGAVNETVASLLAQSGCRHVSMGFQTANNEYKKTVLRRNETKEKVANAIQHLREKNVGYGLDLIFNFPGETKKHVEESLDFFIENKIKWASIYFLNYYPDSYITKYSYENKFITLEQFTKIKKNELIGDQAFAGTIIDKKKTKEQVQYALLFRLLNMFPGKWVKWLLEKNLYKLFPVNRYFYYTITLLTMLLEQGILGVLIFISPYFQFKKSVRK